MKRFTNTGRILTAIFVAAAAAFSVARAQDRQAVPRDGGKQETSQPRESDKHPPRDDAQKPQRRPPDGDERRAQPRETAPRDDHNRRTPDRGEPPRRADGPGRYAFSPVDGRVRFYYHPYFGFYYGPYYGPYYPGAGYVSLVRFNEGALRLKVKPADTEVYVNGYYAGVVDSFDGIFQRLYLPRGEHEITLRLPGYESHTIPVRVRRGETTDIVYDMRRLLPGRLEAPPPMPRPLPREWTEPPSYGEEPASPYGILALRTKPSDAQVVVDGEAWAPVAGQSEFVIHLMAGWHQIEVRCDDYQPFSVRIELIEGQTTRLDANLVRR